jgi:hypothetical protein
MKPKPLLFWAIFFGMTSFVHAEIISWDASSGLLPSDPSIEESSRFAFYGNSSWLSFREGAMNVNEDSTIRMLYFYKDGSIPSRINNWAFQIELRMNSHSGPAFDFGAITGIEVVGRRSLLVISRDCVGFAGRSEEFVNGQKYLMDTTDDFHVYRVIQTSGLVNLFVDTFDLPLISIPYSDLQSSYPGIANFDVKSFLYNPNGTAIPEPAAVSLFALGAILAGRKRK